MLRRAQSSDTATATFLDEGGRTLGVWLPLALADIYAALVALMRPWVENPRALDVPRRSETLASWCLPMLSRSLAADEKERDALALFNAVKNTAAKRPRGEAAE